MKFYVSNVGISLSVERLTQMLQDLKIGIEGVVVSGELTVCSETHPEKIQMLGSRLLKEGSGFAFSRKEILSEKIKAVIIQLVEENELPEVNYSVYISRQLNLNYTYLANIFSETQNLSIEHFFIRQRIGHAIKLLDSGKLTVGQIAQKLHYSSLAHFSSQFKKITGVTPSCYKKNVPGALQTHLKPE